MNIMDIIALAKQGYKPGDIKELIELAKTVPEPEPFNPPAKEPEKDAEGKKEPENPVETPQNDEIENIKKELESVKAENEKVKNDLAKAQAVNRSAKMPETDVDDDKLIQEIVKNFM